MDLKNNYNVLKLIQHFKTDGIFQKTLTTGFIA